MKLLYSIAFALVGSLLLAQAPTATITTASSTICSNRATVFTSTTTNAPTVFTWSMNPAVNAAFLLGNSQPSSIISFSNSGIYTVSLTVSNGSGTVTTTKTVSVLQAPTAAFSASLSQNGYPSVLNLTNYSTNATTYLWSYSETGATDITQDAAHSYSIAGSYSVQLIASNANGCSDTSRYAFFINDSSGVTLPNIFTPNADGINDIFKPIAKGLTNVKCFIYNRYGILVYSWDTVNGFWDGHTTSGEPCISGTYFCVYEATGFDGKSYKLKTYLTLLKD